MSRKLASTAGLALACLVFAGFAQAQDGTRLEAAFKKADKDNDGTLTKDEAQAMPRVAKHFDAIDADKDGTVSAQEIHDFMKAQHGKRQPR
jgi:Ca2+-binding EF-hand superfamily protein